MREKFPNVEPGNAWGMTETSQVVAGIFGDDYAEHPSSCGYRVPVDELGVHDWTWLIPAIAVLLILALVLAGVRPRLAEYR
jgi:hypothetical protein